MNNLELLQAYFPNSTFKEYKFPDSIDYKTNSSNYYVELSIHENGFKYHIYILIDESVIYHNSSNDLERLLEQSKQYMLDLQLKLGEFVTDVMKIDN